MTSTRRLRASAVLSGVRHHRVGLAVRGHVDQPHIEPGADQQVANQRRPAAGRGDVGGGAAGRVGVADDADLGHRPVLDRGQDLGHLRPRLGGERVVAGVEVEEEAARRRRHRRPGRRRTAAGPRRAGAPSARSAPGRATSVVAWLAAGRASTSPAGVRTVSAPTSPDSGSGASATTLAAARRRGRRAGAGRSRPAPPAATRARPLRGRPVTAAPRGPARGCRARR